MNAKTKSSTIPYAQSGYLLIGLFLLAIIGFWESYFSKLFSSDETFNHYFHFHAIMASLWLVILVTQPILINTGSWKLHRRVGMFAHFLIGLFFISAILLTHYQQSIDFHYIGVLIPFRDLSMISLSYAIAMIYRKTPVIHARGMIATGIAFIEPALVRALGNLFPTLGTPYYWTIALIYLTWIVLIIIGLMYKKGQWVFPLIFGLNMVFHAVIVFRIPVSWFERFASWFVGLPLT